MSAGMCGAYVTKAGYTLIFDPCKFRKDSTMHVQFEFSDARRCARSMKHFVRLCVRIVEIYWHNIAENRILFHFICAELTDDKNPCFRGSRPSITEAAMLNRHVSRATRPLDLTFCTFFTSSAATTGSSMHQEAECRRRSLQNTSLLLETSHFAALTLEHTQQKNEKHSDQLHDARAL